MKHEYRGWRHPAIIWPREPDSSMLILPASSEVNKFRIFKSTPAREENPYWKMCHHEPRK